MHSGTYVQHKLDKNNLEEQKKLSRDLRSHHFSYGNDQEKLSTIHKDDYKNNKFEDNKNEENMKYLRSNHFHLGDPTDSYNVFQTTYNNSIGIPKDLPNKAKIENNNFKTSFIQEVPGKPDYASESKAK